MARVSGRTASVKPTVPSSASAGTNSNQAWKTTWLLVRRKATLKSSITWPPRIPAIIAASPSRSRRAPRSASSSSSASEAESMRR